MIFDPRLIFLPLFSLLSILFGIFIYSRSRKNLINLFYGLAVLNIGFWSLGVFLFFTDDPSHMRLWGNFLYFTGSLVVASFFTFTVVFPDEYARIRPFRFALIFAPNVFFFYLLFFTDALIKNALFDSASGSRSFEFGRLYFLYWLYFISILTVSFFTLLRKYRVSNGVERVRLGYVLFASAIAAVFNTTTNVILPTLGNFNYFWLGPYSTFILVFILSVAVIRYRLFNIKVIATELVTVALWIFLVVQIFNTETTQALIINIILLIFVIFLGVLLMQSVTKEVTQRERLELLTTELEKANIELKKLDAAKSEFVSIASHQLRTPLTVIRGYISMALDGTLGSIRTPLKDALEKAAFSTNQLTKLVSDLLDLSRIESGKIQYVFAPADFTSLVSKTIEEMRPAAEKKKVAIALEKGSGEKIQFDFDADKMREVVFNTIDNAIKYSPDGGLITVSVEPFERTQKQWVRFSVKDAGIGIKKEDLQKLFIKFSRTEEAHRVDPDGMGIGLYFVKHIIDDHQGTVRVESEGLGKGSTCIVELPLTRESGIKN